MRLAIMQPYLFPYLGYFQLIHLVDRFVLYDDVQFIKRGWIHRNQILLNGVPHLFTVPVTKAKTVTRINEIQLAPEPRWRNALIKTFRQAYGNAPGFAAVMPSLEMVILGESPFLIDLLRASIHCLVDLLAIETTIVPTSAGYHNDHLRGEDRILDICRLEGADTYLNAPGGRTLYRPAHFEERSVRLRFVNPVLGPYPQPTEPFIEALSMIDVLMWAGVEGARRLVRAGTVGV